MKDFEKYKVKLKAGVTVEENGQYDSFSLKFTTEMRRPVFSATPYGYSEYLYV